MPKILPDLRVKIVENARGHLLGDASEMPSLRTIAAECGIAVGTIYNYFPSKEELMAAVLVDDWRRMKRDMDSRCASAEDFLQGIAVIYDCVSGFNLKYAPVFQSYPVHSKAGEMRKRHVEFRQELQACIMRLLQRFHMEGRNVSALYTEALLASVIQEDLDFDDLKELTVRLFPVEKGNES